MGQISTTALSKKKSISSKEFFGQLTQFGYISKVDNHWTLTPLGIEKGGTYKETDKGDKYIVWPEDLELPEKPCEKQREKPPQKASRTSEAGPKSQSSHQMLITATKIGEHFDLPAVEQSQFCVV